LNGEAPAGETRSGVSTFEQPRVSWPSGSSANHAPSLIDTAPDAMRSVTRTGNSVAPCALKTRTRWPSTMPRARASSG
jgi:hypothetical protein